MRFPCPHLVALTLLLLGPAPLVLAQAVKDGGPPPSRSPVHKVHPPAQTPYEVLTGRVGSVDLVRHVVVLEVAGVPVTLGLDRNTLVYLPTGLGTVGALKTGEEVRAGRNGEDVAYFIEVRASPESTVPVGTPGEGARPGGGGAPIPTGRSDPVSPATETPRLP